jgi:flagellar motor switch protein FliN
MTELNQENVEVVLAALRDKLPDIATSLNQCFDTSVRLELAESGSAAELDATVAGVPGVIVSLNVGPTVMLCAVASSLPLPEWYTEPNASQKACLDTLALEWSLNCLTDDLAPEKYACRAVPNLFEAIQSCGPSDSGVCQPILAASGDAAAAPQLWFVWPVSREPADPAPPPAAAPQHASPPPASAPTARAPGKGPAAARGKPAAPTASRTTASRVHLERLLNLPVQVIVKLAEKKVELGQLSGMGPGAIVTFDKSCEDLLELYVNNQLFCRGEAVKIGEKFGIKVTEVGAAEERASAVLHSHGR